MIRLPRWFIVTIAALLVLNPVSTGLLTIYRTQSFEIALIALALYLVAGMASILYFKELRMPTPLALINLALAVIVPILVSSTLDLSARGSQATWYVSGVSVLMALTAVRSQRTIAWIGTIALAGHVVIWGGLDFIFNSGLAGAIGLVVAAHVISVGLVRSTKEAANYLEQAKETEAATARESAIQLERSQRITQTLKGTLPLLQKIAAGEIQEAERIEARLLEAELRDGIRGRNLVSPSVRESVRRARERGVEVVLLDEGGLDTESESSREGIRERIASELDQVSRGRVTIRALHQGDSRVTFVASRSGTTTPDVYLKL